MQILHQIKKMKNNFDLKLLFSEVLESKDENALDSEDLTQDPSNLNSISRI